MYVAKTPELRKELLNKIIGSKGKGAILKKAITSNSVYHPNLLDNVYYLMTEVIGSVKWRKLVSHFEAAAALEFFEDLDKELGSKRMNDEEVCLLFFFILTPSILTRAGIRRTIYVFLPDVLS